jgi:hypothetical protein
MTTPASRATRWAVCAAVTQEMLNDLVLFAVGEGVRLDPVETDVALPAMGDVRLKVALTITGGTFDLRPDDGGRVRVVVTAAGEVEAKAVGFEGDSAPASPMLPSGPVPIPVRVEALVDPVVELRDDLTMQVGLAVQGGELVGVRVDPDAPTPDGVDPTTWGPMTQMIDMLFATMGEQLWAGLGEHVGVVGTDVGAEVGAVLNDLGVDVGRADVRVGSGLLTLGLPAKTGVVGRATPVPVSGRCVALSLAESGVHQLAALLIPLALGPRPMPFEIQVDLGDQKVEGTLRQSRVLSERVPDLRLSLRTDLRPRLVGGRLEVSLRAAWVELPSLFGGFGLTGVINDVSRRVGELASLAPLRLRFPAVIQVPIGTRRPDGTPDTIGVRIEDLRVTSDGLGVVAGLA